MHWKNSPVSYGLPSKILHWLIALLMIFLLWLGWYMVQLDYYHRWYNNSFLLHQWLGIGVWFLGVLMLAWRFFNPSPAVALRQWERVLSQVVHRLLLFAVLFLPVSGLVVILSDGNTLSIGDFDIPLVMDISDSAREWAVVGHYYVAYGSAIVVVLHGLAALKHHFINRDNILKRML